MVTPVSRKPVLCVINLLILLWAYVVFVYLGSEIDLQEIPVSSVWCSGSKTSERFCFFRNLCYSPRYQEFVFHHHKNSVLSGIPIDRFDPALAELSSVENHNTQYFHYVDLPWANVNQSEIVFIENPTLLFNRFHPENIMHIFHDDLLPLYSTLSMICKKSYKKEQCDVSVVFTDGNPWGPFEDLYKKLFEKVTLSQDLSSDKHHCFKEVYVGVNKDTIWYQYGFKSPQGPARTQNSRTSHLRHFINYFSAIFVNDTTTNKNEEYAVILIRKSNRRILNVKALCATISNVTKLRVKLLSLENYSITEIVSQIQHAKLLLGMHGSILILSLFLKPTSILIELFPYAVNPSHYTPYKTLAHLQEMNIIYEAWKNSFPENTYTHPENPPEMGGIAHLSKEEQKAIVESEEVPLHLCCNNPEWLFRIYQDTVVDLSSFQLTLELAMARNKTNDFENNPNDLQIYPSKVTNPLCLIDIKFNTLNISWLEPWNIRFLNITNLEYELWLQKIPGNDGDVRAYILSKTQHTFTDIENNVDYLIWVRCTVNNKTGPFTDAIKCIKT